LPLRYDNEKEAIDVMDSRMECLEERKAASEVLLRHCADAARQVAPERTISTDSADNDAEPMLLALAARARLLVVGVDGSPMSEAPVFGTEEFFLAERPAGWQEKYPDVPVERVVGRDKPRYLLLVWSRKAQLVMVGSRGRGGFTGLVFGSTSQAMLSSALATHGLAIVSTVQRT
jgi:nucleotide-binding universal stress UspA family protein